ncbi:hypothetical protein C8R45DRAFT_1075117 [Mycena sanguinolenta]|nr:hypothetical protein C8R45DRAFT_1075117 [Mycena sanguinolenta]
MTSITYSTSVTNGPTTAIVAEGECAACDDLEAANTDYTCEQAPVQGKCDGAWDATFTVTFVAPPDFEFIEPGTYCVIDGPIATCVDTLDVGEVPLFQFPPVPGNLDGDEPVLDALAISGIRATHFPPTPGPSKGVFNADLTDGDLGEIFITGWADPVAWIEQTGEDQVKWRKEFNYAGVGTLSGGGAATQVTMATDGFGTLNTMFPGPK